tara:strand:+ start:2339 stop:2794 length:456 start_codon:yes stop_codon:yes gene_type:complete
MARGDSKRFSEYDLESGNGTYNNSTDVFKWVIITDSYTATDADMLAPQLSSFTQVATAGLYVANTTIANTTWTRSGAVSTLDGDDFSFGADGANPTTGKSILIYNDTSPNKDALEIVDLSTDGGTTAADTTQGLTYTVAATGITKVTANPV